MHKRNQAYRRWQHRRQKKHVHRHWTAARHNEYFQTVWDDDPRSIGMRATTPDRCGRWCGVCSRSRRMWGPSYTELRQRGSEDEQTIEVAEEYNISED